MIKKMEFKWETLKATEYNETTRVRVMGGWLVHVMVSDSKRLSTSLQFVQDPDHQWTIVVPKTEEEKKAAVYPPI